MRCCAPSFGPVGKDRGRQETEGRCVNGIRAGKWVSGELKWKIRLISVVIPCYNAAAFLKEAIDSALAQTRQADEIIVVDDASTDGSVEVALSYGDRIRLLRSPNAKGTGHGATANRGVMASQGDYIAFLHADDIHCRSIWKRCGRSA